MCYELFVTYAVICFENYFAFRLLSNLKTNIYETGICRSEDGEEIASRLFVSEKFLQVIY